MTPNRLLLIRLPTGLLLVALAFLVLGPMPALGQADAPGRALRIEEIREQGDAIQYRYRVVGVGTEGPPIEEVQVDLRSPRTGDGPPKGKGYSPRFRFDAIRTQYSDVALSHPPVRVAVPRGWHGAIYRAGYVGWQAKRSRHTHQGVRSGNSQAGFILESSAVPGFREYRAVVAPGPRAQRPGRRGTTSTTSRMYHGFIVAPGFPAEQVTAAYLTEQIRIACRQYRVETCEPYRNIARRVAQAERSVEDAAYREALLELQRRLRGTSTVGANAKWVFRRTAAALLERPPSGRPGMEAP